ncbi:flagellar biosynthetic protein FliR [Acetivibrio cellulolyticus]|uniref:flagellar biosynthetic protein FliR n=1 Tax=Acetivibrio cellulolyticus TaxID=35830 RepID=UPI0001E2C23D|nr:flagellar biosynthetic protein FliR [Acetivibrio cellulolyticus]
MILTEGILVNGIEVFLLIFIRMAGLFVIAPIFSRANIPTYLKIGFSFMLALILVNTISNQNIVINNIYEFAALVIREFVVGITLGYVSYTIFNAIYIAGELIDMQIGFGVVNVIDPISNIQVSITSTFYFILCMLVFILCNGHHILIRALFSSYEYVPLGQAVFGSGLQSRILEIFGGIFLIAFKIAAPMLTAILITDVALGVISKTVPQLNVFVVGMPLKIILGLAVMVLTMPLFISIVETLIKGMDSEMLNFLKNMGPK